MCYVIVTGRSLSWFLLSLLATLCMLSAVLTPKWLVGVTKMKTIKNDTILYTPSVGIYNRCTLLNERNHCGPFSLRGFATDDSVFPGTWKATLFFMALGLTIMCLTVVSGVMSCCFQAICKKSIFSLSGTLQAVSGLFFVIGMVLYPWAWGSARVQRLCGSESAPFFPGDCSFGWAFYCAIIGIVLTFLCGFLSIVAEKATSSDRVQMHIHKGKTLICLP